MLCLWLIAFGVGFSKSETGVKRTVVAFSGETTSRADDDPPARLTRGASKTQTSAIVKGDIK